MRRLLCLLALLSLSTLTWAQGTTSRIAGVVTDSTGAVVAGASVTVTNEATNVSYTTKTSSAGTYVFDSLQIGTYTVAAEYQGFKKFVSKGNVLSIGLPTTVNAALQIGSTGETVEVKGGYDLVQTESSGNIGAVIDNRTLTELPIVGVRGRNPLNFVYTIPGVQDGYNTGGGVTVHGSRDRAWNYTLDGIDINETTSGGSNTIPTKANPDSLTEFRVLTSNFTSEYGRNSGGQVTMVTKSGGNNFHGGLFWFYQSPFLQANNPDSKALQKINGQPNQRPQFVQNIPGFTVGGPIRKNKDFFFVNMQLLHAVNSYLVTNPVYTDQARQGLFRYVIGGQNTAYGQAGASVDANGKPVAGLNIGTYDIAANDPLHVGLDPAVMQYLGIEPLPNNFAAGDGLNTAGYTWIPSQLEKQVDLTFKVDHVFSPTNAVFVRWYSGHQNTFGDSANSGLQTFPGLPTVVDTYRKPRNLAINWRWSPTAKMTNEFVIGESYFGYEFTNPNKNVDQVPPFIFNQPNSGNNGVNGTVTTPLSSWVNNNRYANTMQLVDNFTLAKNAHTLKWGVNFRYLREIDHRGSIGSLNAEPQVYFTDAGTNRPATTTIPTTNFNLPVTGATGIDSSNDLPDLRAAINNLLGRIYQIQQGYVANPDLQTFKPARSWNIMDHRWPEYDFYFQDTWKMRPNLTLDYGLRWEVRIAPHLASFPDLVPNQSVLYGETASNTLKFVKGKLYNSDWNNFGPSVGLAWDPFSDGKMSIRANYRIAYDRINPFSFSSSVFQGMPGLVYQEIQSTPSFRAQNWAIPAPPAGTTPESLTQPLTGVTTLTVADPNMRTPKVYQWSLSIQREVAKNTVLSVSYIGNHGVGLYGAYDANQVNYTANGFLNAFKTAQAHGTSPLLDQLLAPVLTSAQPGAGTTYLWNNYATNLRYNSVAQLANSLANYLVNGVPLVQATNTLGVTPLNNPFFFKPYPQALGAMRVLNTMGYSNYNGLETQIERRFSNGLLFQGNWVWSKSLDIRSYDPAFTIYSTGTGQSAQGTLYDFHNPRLNYGPGDGDRTQVFKAVWVYDLPFGRGQRFASKLPKVLDYLVGGWEVAGDALWETGRPITFLSNSYGFNGVVMSPVSCTGKCDPKMGSIFWKAPTGSTAEQQWFLPMVDLLPTSVSPTRLDANMCRMFADGSGGLCVPPPGEVSNIGRNYFRQNRIANLDATIAKSFQVREGHTLQARLEMQNVTNSQMFDTFGSQTITSAVFARLNQALDGVRWNSARRMQLSLKYTF